MLLFTSNWGVTWPDMLDLDNATRRDLDVLADYKVNNVPIIHMIVKICYWTGVRVREELSVSLGFCQHVEI